MESREGETDRPSPLPLQGQQPQFQWLHSPSCSMVPTAAPAEAMRLGCNGGGGCSHGRHAAPTPELATATGQGCTTAAPANPQPQWGEGDGARPWDTARGAHSSICSMVPTAAAGLGCSRGRSHGECTAPAPVLATDPGQRLTAWLQPRLQAARQGLQGTGSSHPAPVAGQGHSPASSPGFSC